MQAFKEWVRRDRRRGLLLWTALVGLLFGLFDLGRPLEDGLLVARNTLRQHKASGDIVIVGIDDRSLAEVGAWPWPRGTHGELATRLERLGARRIALNFDFSSPTRAESDQALANALASLKQKPIVSARFVFDPITGKRTDLQAIPLLRPHIVEANVNARLNYSGSAWELPFAVTALGTIQTSLAARLAGTDISRLAEFRIDYAIDPRTIPTLSAIDVLRGEVPRSAVAGKTVLIGATSTQLNETYFLPGLGEWPAAYLHVLGAETLRAGQPGRAGWLMPFAAAILVAGLALTRLTARRSVAVMVITACALFCTALHLESLQIEIRIVPALILLVCASGVTAIRALHSALHRRGTINAISGLPNLNALKTTPPSDPRPLIVAKVHNYAEMVSTLPDEAEQSIMRQIASRLAIGGGGTAIHHGDDGIFAWFFDAEEVALVREYLDGLHALLMRPISAETRQVDLNVTFGLDAGKPRAVGGRLASARLAAEEAAAEGRRWKQHDAGDIDHSMWKLSLLSQLDSGIDSGEVWVAYQPKVDVRTGRIVGAEALARWSHPDKGEISPIEFVRAAEQSGRIGKLTTFVLDQAIGVAREINDASVPFEVAVNISGRLLSDYSLPTIVSELLAHHRLAPSQLTLEITETAAISSSPSALAPLRDLRDLGVRISIDDYGTGLSTLEYVRRMPASEIKIDRQFIGSMATVESDRIMVQSTINLAHSLGQKVVAEGVEEEETLRMLKVMGCDLVQGFFTGVPMTYQRLRRILQAQGEERAA